MSESLTIYEGSTGVVERLGTPEERQYLMQVMAEKLGIPSSEADRRDVIALIAKAAEYSMSYGWIPGVHMHVQKFETKRSRDRRKENPDAPQEWTYTLVDGEKAWKDSGARWRIKYGVRWVYQDRPMKREELENEARAMGFNEQIPGNAFGIWSRVIEIGLHDPSDHEMPMWSFGAWFGKIRVGNYWNSDALPTGVSPRDVALRRAHKRAMMASHLPLLELDDRTPDERMEVLQDNLRREAEHKRMEEKPIQRPKAYREEPDGNILYAEAERPAQKGQWEEVHQDSGDDSDHEVETTPEEENDDISSVEEDIINDVCAGIYEDVDYKLSGDVAAVIEKVTELDNTSEKPMSAQDARLYHQLFYTLVVSDESSVLHKWTLSALTQRPISQSSMPGEKVAGILEWMKDPNKHIEEVESIKQLAFLCEMAAQGQ